jgi:hypothetical protein
LATKATTSGIFANDITVNGLTVGLGGGAVSTNTVVGNSAGINNTSGIIDAFGYGALQNNTTGPANAAFGQTALFENTTGSSNSAFGRNSLYANTTGSYNTAAGTSALSANTTGSNNTGLGWQSLLSNTTASDNTAVGYQAGYSNTTATLNTFLGFQAGYANTTGVGITAVGSQVLLSNTTGGGNVGVGGNWYGVTGAALAANTTGTQNTAVGAGVLASTTTGSYNAAVGTFALGTNTTGGNNTAFGVGTLGASTTESNNTAVGYEAGYSNTTGTNNLLLGYQAGYTNSTGSNNVMIGVVTGNSTTSSNNTFVGQGVGYLNSTGTQNTYVGVFNPTTSYAAGAAMTTGSYNTIIGAFSGDQGGLNITTASNYIVLSDGAGNPQQVIDGTNWMWATVNTNLWTATSGSGLKYTTGDALTVASTGVTTQLILNNTLSNTAGTFSSFRMGGTQIGSISPNGTTAVNYNTTSDYRLKENATPISNGLTTIEALNPVTFDWISDKTTDSGFLAHEFQAVIPRSVTGTKDAVDAEGKPVYQAMDNSGAVPYLVAAIKELNTLVTTQAAQIAALQAKVGA